MAKLNKDGIVGGKLLTYKEHTQLLLKKRKAAKVKAQKEAKEAEKVTE